MRTQAIAAHRGLLRWSIAARKSGQMAPAAFYLAAAGRLRRNRLNPKAVA